MDVNTDQLTLEEVNMAIKVMKNGKAPGSDGVTAEMLKAEYTVIPRLLTKIFSDIWETENIPEDWKSDIWETENIPEDWKMGLIINLPKKGDIWRGITLLSLTSKVFSKVIQERLTKALEQQIREE